MTEERTNTLMDMKEAEEEFLERLRQRRAKTKQEIVVQMKHASPTEVEREGMKNEDLPEAPLRVTFNPAKQSSSKCAPAYVLAAGAMTEDEFYEYKEKNKRRLTLSERAAMDLVENAVINGEEKDKDRFWNLSTKLYEGMLDRENKATMDNQNSLNLKPDALMNDIFSKIEQNLDKIVKAPEAEVVDHKEDDTSQDFQEPEEKE